MTEDDEQVLCGGNADPNDSHLSCTVVAIDAEIFAVLKRREKSRMRKHLPTVQSRPAMAAEV
jgi:hypothetical protein